MDQVGSHIDQVAGFRRMVSRPARWLLVDTNPAGAVFGLITVGALLAAESKLAETYLELVGSVALTMVLYWFAHSYSEVLGSRLVTRQRADWGRIRWIFAHEWSIIKGAGLPLVALLVAWALGASQTTAATAGVWTAAISLVAFEIAAGVRANAGGLELTLDAVVGATMGIAILALRTVVG